ncbi:hypothetical protein PENTCL1PPCAC_21961, partial [Pristionchus entomophagus]
CGKRFSRMDERRNHFQKVHLKKKVSTTISFESDVCGKSFSRKCALVEHKRIHLDDSDEKKYPYS